MSSSPLTPRPVYIDQNDPVFGIYHEAHGPARDRAVILCPPFGWEDMCSYRGRREWAMSLASDGFSTLRIDFPGSGDSGGGPRDRERLRAWTGALESAAKWLSSTASVNGVAAIGIGLGGLIAYRALVLGAPIDDLVLWGVHSRGRRHVREMMAFAYMEIDQRFPDSETGPVTREDPDGSLAVAGYVMTSETRRALDQLDLSELDPSPLKASRVLMLERDSQPVDDRLRSAVESSGAELTVASGNGFAAMMTVELPYAVSAYSTFDTASRWLTEGSLPVEDTPTASSGFAQGDPQPAHLELTVSRSRAAEEYAEIKLPGGELVRETPISISHPFGDPFGILAEPVGPRRDLCAVWLNAGPQRRTGPNRMWVETARRWAAQGVPTFRVDLAGIGDAEGDSEALRDIRSYFVPGYQEQLSLILDTLQARGLPDRFLLGGLCAGGYWGLQAAQADSRVSAVIALNPSYIVYDGGVTKAMDNARGVLQRLRELPTWRRVFRGQVSPSAHLVTLRTLIGGCGHSLLRNLSRLTGAGRGLAGDHGEVAQVFDRLQARNQRTLLIFAGNEWPYVQLLRKGQLSGLERWPRISVQHINVAGNMHTLRPLALQQQAHELVDELLHRELELEDRSRSNHLLVANEH